MVTINLSRKYNYMLSRRSSFTKSLNIGVILGTLDTVVATRRVIRTYSLKYSYSNIWRKERDQERSRKKQNSGVWWLWSYMCYETAGELLSVWRDKITYGTQK